MRVDITTVFEVDERERLVSANCRAQTKIERLRAMLESKVLKFMSLRPPFSRNKRGLMPFENKCRRLMIVSFG